jgi:hypothetical protein
MAKNESTPQAVPCPSPIREKAVKCDILVERLYAVAEALELLREQDESQYDSLLDLLVATTIAQADAAIDLRRFLEDLEKKAVA